MLDLPEDTGVSIAVGDMLNYLLFIVDDVGVNCERCFGGRGVNALRLSHVGIGNVSVYA